jgi:D-arabinitol dehydrogenase (NADP+)
VLILGAGPTGKIFKSFIYRSHLKSYFLGLILSQLLKLNGAAKVVIAANKGVKTRLAQELDAADEYIELDRENPDPQWEKLKVDYPYGFDAVVGLHFFNWLRQPYTISQVEATGSEKVANQSINYVRRGGTLMIYGVYSNSALVHWPPSKIFGDEIRVCVLCSLRRFLETHCRAKDRRLVCSNLLLPSCGQIFGQRKGQGQGYGMY